MNSPKYAPPHTHLISVPSCTSEFLPTADLWLLEDRYPAIMISTNTHRIASVMELWTHLRDLRYDSHIMLQWFSTKWLALGWLIALWPLISIYATKHIIASILELNSPRWRLDLISIQLLGPRMKMRVPYSNHSVCPSVRLSVRPQMLVDAAVAKVSKVAYPNWVCGLPIRCRCAWA